MFYPNDYSVKNLNKKNLTLNKIKDGINADIDENLEDGVSPMSYNFSYVDGSLRDGFGVKPLQFKFSEDGIESYKILDALPNNSFAVGCWLFTSWAVETHVYRAFLIVYAANGDFYYNRLHNASTEFVKIEGLNFAKKPVVSSYKIDGIDTLILVSDQDGMYTWQFPNLVKKVENTYGISSMCIHNNKLFVTTAGDRRSILYSSNIDPTNFSYESGGVIDFVDEFGKCNKIISFNGSVYIFRDFNIAKLTMHEDKEGYNLEQLFVSNGRIYDNSVCVCGNKIIYLAADGVYEFDGSKAKRMKLNINKIFKDRNNSHSIAGYSNGYYYLACNVDYGDSDFVGEEHENIDQYNNCLIKLNVFTGHFYLMRGYDIRDIAVINDIYKSEVCIISKNIWGGYKIGILDESGKFLGDEMAKCWKSSFNDFGVPEKYKIVNEITLETAQDITLEVKSEMCVKAFSLKGKIGYQTIRPFVKGKKIGINFKSNVAGNYISSPKINVSYL